MISILHDYYLHSKVRQIKLIVNVSNLYGSDHKPGFINSYYKMYNGSNVHTYGIQSFSMKTDAYNIRQMITVFGYNYWNSTACKLQVEREREREREREILISMYVKRLNILIKLTYFSWIFVVRYSKNWA